MNIEIREDSVVITGYVNAVERYSKPITETLHGKLRTFIERIKCGAFKKALKRNDDVKVLLNHDYERELATTKNGTAELTEDNIGLRAKVTITDKEVMEKAKNNELVGWSFGFYANDDVLGMDGEQETRTVTDLDLIEVSILDNSKVPAYNGTLIEARNERKLETREGEVIMDENIVTEEQLEQQEDLAKLEALANAIVDKLMAKFDIKPQEEPKEEPQPQEPPMEEPRAIDYSSFEQRLKNL